MDDSFDTKTESVYGHTALTEAVHYRADLSVLETLITRGADINSGGSSGYLPLVAAVRRNPPALDLLLAAGADPNARAIPSASRSIPAIDTQPVWYTPVADALCVSVGSLHRLLGAGGDPMNAVEDVSLVRLACERCFREGLDHLIRRGWHDESIGSSLQLAASAGCLEQVREHLQSGEAVDSLDAHSRTALAMAVCADRPSIVAELVAQGADSQQTITWCWSATMPACGVDNEFPGMGVGVDGPRVIDIARSSSVALTLFDAGASLEDNPSLSGPARPPALNVFAESGRIDILCTLVRAGACIQVSDGLGKTPVHELSMRGDWKSIRQIVALGANVNARDHDGATPLMYAAANVQPATVATLLSLGASSDVRDESGWTACDHALAERPNWIGRAPEGEETWESRVAIEATINLLS